ncbi:hypothetical protein BURKHO8Y_270043 [Burkholderia sp. 8Y]|nr:hypothetical protein BURKHO8Y_270043 [Burkholderia sp. 8Y]
MQFALFRRRQWWRLGDNSVARKRVALSNVAENLDAGTLVDRLCTGVACIIGAFCLRRRI